MRSGGWFEGLGRGMRRLRRSKRRLRRGAGGRRRRRFALSLADLSEGESGILDSLDLPEDVALRMMELGFLPGTAIEAGKSAPGGDPRVYRVDGGEIAIRLETARSLVLKSSG